MATPRTATPPTPATDANNPGIFISTTALGYVQAPAGVIAQINASLRALPAIPRQVLEQLLTIKLLAPQESRELVIYNVPEAVKMINEVRAALSRRYYEQGLGDKT